MQPIAAPPDQTIHASSAIADAVTLVILLSHSISIFHLFCSFSSQCLGAIAATWGTDELSKPSLRVARVDDGLAQNTHPHIL